MSVAPRSVSDVHNFEGFEESENRAGYPVPVGVCSCGRKGSGSRTYVEAKAGWVKHARGHARSAAAQPRAQRIRTSPDW